MCKCICSRIHTDAHMQAYMHMHKHTNVRRHAHAYMHTRMDTHLRRCMHAYLYARKHAHTHVLENIRSQQNFKFDNKRIKSEIIILLINTTKIKMLQPRKGHEIFGCWFDEGRICRRVAFEHTWSVLATKSIDRFRTIEKMTGKYWIIKLYLT